jgi:hypothetical protein
VNQHTGGRRIAAVEVGDRDSWVFVVDDASGEVLERASIPPNDDAFRA